MVTNRDDLIRQVAAEEARLEEIESARRVVTARLQSLRAELACRVSKSSAVAGPDSSSPSAETPQRTRREKLDIFRNLFRGRTDVFPKDWQNSRTGKKGYSPACSNDWVRGVCEKPRVKCGECPHQAFVPVTDRVVLDHLLGRHVAGVYPLLEDETCWFLALDFDKGSWETDVAAFVETSRAHGLHPAVERSRSGEGAHVWFFFSEPVTAVAARRMGCYLVTETMSLRHELSMDSYDRLFPNQDTMPRGGFGNLIALPFQHAARKRGNTLFVDDTWVPYPDQWSFLARIPRLTSSHIEKLAAEAEETGRIVGVRAADSDVEGGASPWLRRPKGQSARIDVGRPLPERVTVVHAQQLFVDKVGLPPALLDGIKRLAAFQNPEFYKRQALRLSTARTPRVICCSEELPRHIGLPRGCMDDLEGLLHEQGVELLIEDRRTNGDPLDLEFRGELSGLQEEAACALEGHDAGVFVAPPGSGKTVVAANLLAKRGRSTLVLVHRAQLLEQWRAQLAVFLDIDPKAIGQVGAGKRRPTGRLDVATVQSLVRGGRVSDLVAEYGHVVIDECHHVPAVSFERLMKEVRARFVTGLTATPQRRDGHHPILRFRIGPVRCALDAKRPASQASVEHRVVVRETGFRMWGEARAIGIQGVYGRLATDDARNDMIVDDVFGALEEGAIAPVAHRTTRPPRASCREASVRRASSDRPSGRDGHASAPGSLRTNGRHPGRRGTTGAGDRAVRRRGV